MNLQISLEYRIESTLRGRKGGKKGGQVAGSVSGGGSVMMQNQENYRPEKGELWNGKAKRGGTKKIHRTGRGRPRSSNKGVH